MLNVRAIVRSVTLRLKTSANGNIGSQTTKEGRSELEDEYKHLWSSNVRNLRLQPNGIFSKSFFLTSSKQSPSSGGGSNDSDSEKHDWDAWRLKSNSSWIEALGWGAVLGLGFNAVHSKQEELLRKRCPFGYPDCNTYPRWFSNFALSMPYSLGQPGLVKSVLPYSSGRSRDSFSMDETPSSEHSSEDSVGSSGGVSDYERPTYTSEAAALMSVLRDQLSEMAGEYITGLQLMLGASRPAEKTNQRSKAQEEYNLGLFHELGIGVPKNSEQAFTHYVEAAFLDHPIALRNLVALHKYTSAPGNGSAMHRSSSSPTLSMNTTPTYKDYPLTQQHRTTKKPSGRFWSDDDSSSSASSLSRSSSFPDLLSVVACK